MMKGRVIGALAILVAWLTGMGMLVRREFFRPHIDRLAEAALRVTPGATFYAVLQGDRQVGFASSTLDTALSMIELRDYLVTDIPVNGAIRRSALRTNVTLTRTLRVRTFEIVTESDSNPMRVTGDIAGDTLLTLVRSAGASAPDTQRTTISGPLLLPGLAPLAVVLEAEPDVGDSYVLPIFDPSTMTPRDVRIRVQAETLFVVNDSSVYDSTSSRWRPVRPDTVRAWRLVAEGGSGISGWVDQQGRMVATTQMGYGIERRPYEVAYENWRMDVEALLPAAPRAAVARRASSSNRSTLETGLIVANKRPSLPGRLMRARVRGVPLEGFELNGGRQQLRGDTVTITVETASRLVPRYRTLVDNPQQRRIPTLRAEPFIEADHAEMIATAQSIVRGQRDPRVVASRLVRWVHDSVRKEPTTGFPGALHTLRTRRGDAAEHAQLFVALSRAAGIPARIATGFVYADGRFYSHVWPEVMLRGWVAVDPTFGQLPAGAGHLRFLSGGLGRQADLQRLAAGLTIDVLQTR